MKFLLFQCNLFLEKSIGYVLCVYYYLFVVLLKYKSSRALNTHVNSPRQHCPSKSIPPGEVHYEQNI